MTGRRPDPREVARFLRQREEAGMPPLFLERAGRAQVLEAVRAAAAGAPAPAVLQDSAPAAAEAAGGSGVRAAAGVAPGGGGDASADVSTMDYDTLRETALQCTRCRLAQGRTQVVFSDGNPEARLVVVGEAPGANEDRTGLPFVGAAGKLLDLMLAAVDLSRQESVYICNVLKCRPPGNRNPQLDEIETCSPYLRRQLELVRPQALLAVGTFAAQLLTGSQNALGKLRGSVYSYEGVPLVVTYHPAALLRNPSWSRPTWDDLQLLRGILDQA